MAFIKPAELLWQSYGIKLLKKTEILDIDMYVHRSPDISVGIATGCGLDDRGVGSSSPGRVKIFTSTYRPDRLWGPPTGGSFPEVKRQGREADHSPPPSADVKKMWIYTSTPPYVFMA
jgi:hypothetical protein